MARLSGAGAVHGIVPLPGHDGACLRGDIKGDVLAGEALGQPVDLKADDVLDLLVREAVEDDDFVHAVQEFRPEVAAQCLHDPAVAPPSRPALPP